MRRATYAQAVREALAEKLREDARVFLIGEDIGAYGGAFGVTGGLKAEFGDRIMETPISESAIIGSCIGAALTGMRPVAELMFSDFMAVCYDQLINQAAKLRYMSGGSVSVPMVVRTACGGGTGAGAQHSQSLEAMYTGIPGLKVVMPSTPYDAKGLLKASIDDKNPVMFLEPKQLYSSTGGLPDGDYRVPLGRAEVKRIGRDVTVIAYGSTVPMALEAAGQAERMGVQAEVVDIRTLLPLDINTIFTSVEKTGRVVITHEATEFGGFGGELAAQITGGELFYSLKAPVKRVGAAFCPLPSSKAQEAHVLPGVSDICAAIFDTVRSRRGFERCV